MSNIFEYSIKLKALSHITQYKLFFFYLAGEVRATKSCDSNDNTIRHQNLNSTSRKNFNNLPQKEKKLFFYCLLCMLSSCVFESNGIKSLSDNRLLKSRPEASRLASLLHSIPKREIPISPFFPFFLFCCFEMLIVASDVMRILIMLFHATISRHHWKGSCA